ncbi:hypothetical protein ACCUM_3816 [Candidatus Accumulibacter phosphatis]|uniref:Uncharacterized protein n=1 Tax=Candidatus Accumulibacter phosphatis TaxID=327160 RepID=A0A5S4EHI9_9PROT|nr:hypothetical protein ACCUM_3816 [Candidatus Accumulibacter phosphatis]
MQGNFTISSACSGSSADLLQITNLYLQTTSELRQSSLEGSIHAAQHMLM